MRAEIRITGTRILAFVVAAIVAGIAGALLIAWSGVYNVAASRGHPAWLNWFLELGMRNSVESNAGSLKPPDLGDPDLIALGAAHFQGGCAPCHGAPGQPVNPIYQGMLPSPPVLREEVGMWTPNELHWIVKHGLQYAGMPGWAATGRDDEVWAMVAFLRALPDLTEEDYAQLAAGNASLREEIANRIVLEGTTALSLSTCSKCHDTPDAPATSSRVPRLAGQPQAYLLRTLNDYRANRRQSGFMEPVAAEIPDEMLGEIAAYFSDLNSPTHATEPSETADLESGRTLALAGDPARRVAACHACHDSSADPQYPRLAGQSVTYMELQLRRWRDEPASETGYDALMAEAMGKITDEQIRDVSAWYGSLAQEAPPE